MATVRLYRNEVKQDRLPSVCMRCGAPADLQKCKRFSWYPGWVNVLFLVGILPWAIVAIVLTKRMTVYVPLCSRHKNHWLVRTLVVLGGLAVIGAGFVATIALAVAADGRAGQGADQLGGYACVGALVALLLLIIVAVIAQITSIRPSEITDRTITLVGVAPEFKKALQELDDTDSGPPADYDEHFQERANRPRAEEYFDPEGPRRPPRDQEA
jgi:hypothetical protein